MIDGHVIRTGDMTCFLLLVSAVLIFPPEGAQGGTWDKPGSLVAMSG